MYVFVCGCAYFLLSIIFSKWRGKKDFFGVDGFGVFVLACGKGRKEKGGEGEKKNRNK